MVQGSDRNQPVSSVRSHCINKDCKLFLCISALSSFEHCVLTRHINSLCGVCLPPSLISLNLEPNRKGHVQVIYSETDKRHWVMKRLCRIIWINKKDERLFFFLSLRNVKRQGTRFSEQSDHGSAYALTRRFTREAEGEAPPLHLVFIPSVDGVQLQGGSLLCSLTRRPWSFFGGLHG